MAPPRAGGPRRSHQPNEHIYTLGERGRKTGVTLRDTGVRDEHGMEPIDDIFSSPAKSRDGNVSDGDDGDDNGEEEAAATAAAEQDEDYDEDEEDDDDNGEADMDLTTASGPDPAALINGQRSAARRAFNQTRSPAKALFGSPAVRGAGAPSSGALRQSAAIRQNPLLRPPSSPENIALQHSSSPVKPVKRRLDFGKATSANAQRRPFALAPPNGSSVKRPQQRQLQQDDDDNDDDNEEDEDEENILHGNHYPQNGADADESMQMIGEPDSYGDDGGDGPEEEQLDRNESIPAPVPNRRGRPPGKAKSVTTTATSTKVAADEPKAKKRGRPARNSSGSNAPADPDEDDEAEQQQQQHREQAKRQRLEEVPKAPGRPRGRPPANRSAADTGERQRQPQAEPEIQKKKKQRKSSGVGAATAAAAAVPRGPPLPKGRGLVIKRRPLNGEDGDAITQTRSGRNSIQPLAFWRNERVEFDTSDVQLDRSGRATSRKGQHFVLPSVREIHRVEDEDLPPLSKSAHSAHGGNRHRRNAAGRPKSKRRGGDDNGESEEDYNHELEREPWETDPGTVSGSVAIWYPEHELEPPAPGQPLERMSAEIAMSSAAIKTEAVRDGSFRFVKTLSLPFFGTGMVDLPPGTEKRLKNARKMHMAFFVHYGQVLVTVSETSFRIAKGGMWSVPRGNYYSIVNDSDHPARIFFAQGCEKVTVLEPDDEGRQ
ncbi:cupin domain containing protein [Niveomyces insectorum RCEF 264]|uniref:CENP-C homolog n=1 Tax=Niveomyces insectorum RCEF 264 TaxID=1081102 RepID=A0A167Z6C8_9HYPO|nr:cupin domain containing protein [Niveomyces insectorum RCEF 264]